MRMTMAKTSSTLPPPALPLSTFNPPTQLQYFSTLLIHFTDGLPAIPSPSATPLCTLFRKSPLFILITIYKSRHAASTQTTLFITPIPKLFSTSSIPSWHITCIPYIPQFHHGYLWFLCHTPCLWWTWLRWKNYAVYIFFNLIFSNFSLMHLL